MTNDQPARVRVAPSPTGRAHIGFARTALYNYLLARQTGGQFILRIEDTDQKRYVPESEDELKDSLRWLGLDWDEGPEVGGPHAPYRQSERKAIYAGYADELLDSGNAFYCFMTPEETQAMRAEQQQSKRPTRIVSPYRDLPLNEARARVANGERAVVRFKMPREGTTTVRDRLRGDITVENSTLDDFVLVKSDGLALYHLAAMVDDHLMGVSHVMRGSEWLGTLPLHARIYRALGWQEPDWIHLSVFLKPSGKGKLSKRDSADLMKDGHSVFVTDLRKLGYTPEAVLNWMALMGWSYDDKTEFFTLDDLVETFSLDRLNPSPAAINFSKFDHFNGLHIRALAPDELARRLAPYFDKAGIATDQATLAKIAPLIQERIATLDEAPELAGFFFRDDVEAAVEDLLPKKMTEAETLPLLQAAITRLDALPDFDHATTHDALNALAEELGVGRGPLFQPLRVAISGQRVSPPLFETMEIVGRETSMQRLQDAEARLKQRLAG